MMENYTLSDVASVARGNDFGGGWMWIIVLFLFAFGGFGARGGAPVTESGLCDAMNFNNLENAVGRLSDQNAQQTAQISNGICQLGYDLQGQIGTLSRDVALGNANLAQQMAACCCGIERGLDGVNYNNAINTAAINKNIDDKFAALEKSQLQQTINAQQAQIGQLQLAQALCGVVRYPTSTTYATTCNPFFGGFNGCGCN